MSTLTRDQARTAFNATGLTYEVLTLKALRRLRVIINRKMKQSGLIDNNLRCNPRVTLSALSYGLYGEIKCHSFYFKNREAVSFNPDGFIGFAGWSDETNVQPILEGFIDWINELTTENQLSHAGQSGAE